MERINAMTMPAYHVQMNSACAMRISTMTSPHLNDAVTNYYFDQNSTQKLQSLAKFLFKSEQTTVQLELQRKLPMRRQHWPGLLKRLVFVQCNAVLRLHHTLRLPYMN
jgi:hypothetical protein